MFTCTCSGALARFPAAARPRRRHCRWVGTCHSSCIATKEMMQPCLMLPASHLFWSGRWVGTCRLRMHEHAQCGRHLLGSTSEEGGGGRGGEGPQAAPARQSAVDSAMQWTQRSSGTPWEASRCSRQRHATAALWGPFARRCGRAGRVRPGRPARPAAARTRHRPARRRWWWWWWWWLWCAAACCRRASGAISCAGADGRRSGACQQQAHSPFASLPKVRFCAPGALCTRLHDASQSPAHSSMPCFQSRQTVWASFHRLRWS